MTKAEFYLYDVLNYLMTHYGVDRAYQDIDPLQWYILTGRASVDFLNKLYQKKPYLIARRLHQGGSGDETIKRIKTFIGC